MEKRPGFKKKVDIQVSKSLVTDILKQTDKALPKAETSSKGTRRINAESFLFWIWSK